LRAWSATSWWGVGPHFQALCSPHAASVCPAPEAEGLSPGGVDAGWDAPAAPGDTAMLGLHPVPSPAPLTALHKATQAAAAGIVFVSG
jgi:hypothetical protein